MDLNDFELQHNRTYVKNAAKIVKAYTELFNETGEIPSYRAIAKKAGVSYTTVMNHIRTIKLDNVANSHKLRINPILKALGDKALTGDPQAVKLWMQLAMGWAENTKQDISATIENKTLQIEVVEPVVEEPKSDAPVTE